MVPKQNQFDPIKYDSKNSKVEKPIKIDKNVKKGEEDDTESSNSEGENNHYLSEYFWDAQALQEI